MPNGQPSGPRHVRFLEAALQPHDPRRAVWVRLQRHGETITGRSDDGHTSLDEMRHAAEAALDALRQLVGQGTTLTLEAVSPVAAVGHSFVIAVVAIRDAHGFRTVLGVCPLSLNLLRDAALAVLDATNRVLGLS